MSTNPSPNSDSSNQPLGQSQNLSWREQRRVARQDRRALRLGSRGGTGLGGIILILLGAVFLLQNMGAVIFGNWWALFILLPAVGAFSAAWRSFSRGNGQVSGTTISSFIVGVVFTALTLALFFSFDLTWLGPTALILIGMALLVATFMRPGAT
ncbi:MAG: hypothetical protein HZB51_26215 [Chloroflexi bacterium]|nr:hypothetical protein [Chloroflexota bacterium]